ncbi:MAG: hypothetical protein JXL80_18205 [Planctomycetes bacterium]|nr:hypothetical protein [Planctomycetota bacterium]
MAHHKTLPDGTIVMVVDGASAITTGTKIVAAAATPESLVAVSTPCRAVWLGARVNSTGVALNTKPVFIGGAAGQHIPVMPNNPEGLVIAIDDASKLKVKVGTNGEGVNYAVLA